MTKIDVKAVLKQHGFKQNEIAIQYYGRTPSDEKEAKSMAVQFGKTFVNPGCNPTVDSLTRLATLLNIDVIEFFVGDGTETFDFVSPETGKRYKMIPID